MPRYNDYVPRHYDNNIGRNYGNNNHYQMRVDEQDVPESRHAIFFRGLGKDVSQDQVK